MERLTAMPRFAAGALFGALCCASAPSAQAQEYIETFTDWKAYHMQEHDGQGNTVRTCFIYSEATSHTGPGGDGAARVYVTHRPWRDETGIVSVSFPFDPDAEAVIKATIGPNSFDMKTWGTELAFLYEGMDPELVDAMVRGLELVISTPAADGSRATDTFSLRGFSAAYREIGTACGVS